MLQPLIDFCDRPLAAPDRFLQIEDRSTNRPLATRPSVWELVRFTYRKGGLGLVARHTVSRLRRVAASRLSR